MSVDHHSPTGVASGFLAAAPAHVQRAPPAYADEALVSLLAPASNHDHPLAGLENESSAAALDATDQTTLFAVACMDEHNRTIKSIGAEDGGCGAEDPLRLSLCLPL